MLWVVTGGVLLLNYSNKDLFFFINSRHTEQLDVFMYYTTWVGEGVIIVSVLSALMLFPRFRTWQYFFSALLCNLLPFFIQQGIKSYYDSPRPINYFKHAEWIHRAKEWPELLYRSYPSGHTAGAFCFLCFLSLCLPRRYRYIGLILFIIAMVVGYSRVYLSAHFFADIYAGSIVGTVFCILIYSVVAALQTRFSKKKGTFI
ncbi:MAG: phosphoesterase PA-phosphatase related [Flavipsychrobacter sp.]|nr:phosphoesterase PA-phosphatase related [Flavipsychrobacter sp.]